VGHLVARDYAGGGGRRRRAGFRLRRATFAGDGVAPEFDGESWPTIRDAIYRERGA
jgi:hypothetical protein